MGENIKAGIDFILCKDKNGSHPCAWCKPEKQRKCETLLALDRKYSDDPRNVKLEPEGRL